MTKNSAEEESEQYLDKVTPLLKELQVLLDTRDAWKGTFIGWQTLIKLCKELGRTMK